jgi:tetratricopeptide (TPR) repeat protein
MNIDETIQLALENLRSGNPEQAENLLYRVLSVQPDNINALHFLGLVYYESKNYDLAIEYIKKVLCLNPSYADAYNNLGLAMQEKGELNEAILCYQKALELNPDFKIAYDNLRNLLMYSGYIDSFMTDSTTTRTAISSANKARDLLRTLIHKEQYSAISIGQNCNTAWYLRQVGAKTASYPFDWIFSSAGIAESCLRNSFSDFLNKQYLLPKKDWCSAGHSLYHANMFHHRSPLQTEDDYDYYLRCVDRFNNILSSGGRIILVCTIIKEPDKNLPWSNGFGNEYPLPTGQSHRTYRSFIEYAGKINHNLKYLFIEQYTEGTLTIDSEIVDDNVLSVRFISRGKNDGVKYLDDFDDFIAKLLYSGLII